jgi:phage-related protein
MMARTPDKPLVWLRGEVKTPPFSSEARVEAGFLLRRLQKGESLGLPHSRPMPSIGPQCHELRINDENQAWRIAYHVATDAVVILDVFGKKTAATPNEVLTNCKRRLAAYISVVPGRKRKRR